MAKFQSRPVQIEAEQFFHDKPLPFWNRRACHFVDGRWIVVTAHGQETQIVDGDWIVAEPDGRGFYPVKPDIFCKRWEPCPSTPESNASSAGPTAPAS
jgi:hypothetical protein